jgi:predicted metal-dependent hydrolase
VAHLAELNHGPKFWALVGRMFPAHQPARDWLKKYGPALYMYR